MPYIPQERRDAFFHGDDTPQTAGELNYAITRAVTTYVRVHGESYQTINDALGALEGAKLEFYRRLAAPYENTKIQQNGELYF